MLLYRHFRLKKYGEALPGSDGVDEDLFEEDKEMIRRIQALRQKDPFAGLKRLLPEPTALESIAEDSSSDEFSDKYVKTKKAAQEFGLQTVAVSVIADEIISLCQKIMKVKSFVHMAVIRWRFLKMKKAVQKIAGLFRIGLTKKKAR